MNLAWKRLIEICREPDGTAGSAITAETKTETATEDDDGDDGDAPDADDPSVKDNAWERYAKKLRRENGQRRANERALKAQNTALQSRLTTDLETLRTAAKADQDRAVAEAVAQSDARVIRIELRYALKEAGCTDVDAALTLIDKSGIKFNDSGEIVGHAEAIKALKEGKAYLFGTASSTTTTSTTKAPTPAGTEPKNARDMTPEEYRVARSAFAGSSSLRRRTY